MESPPRSRRRFSVRGLSNVVIGALALLALAVVGGLLWTSALLQQTSALLVRETRSMESASEIALQLLAHQRMANVALLTGETEAIEARDGIEQDVLALLGETERFAPSQRELELMKEAGADIQVYLKERRRLEEQNLPAWEVISGARPLLNDAVDALEALRHVNERQVREADDRAQRIGAAFTTVSFGAGAVILVLLVLFAVAVRQLLLRPILGLRGAIEQFRGGDRSARAPPEGPRELVEIAGAFNDMSAQLARQREEQLAFLGGVAHDLRNPLHGLKMGVQVLQLQDVSPQRRERTLAMLEQQIEHLTRMVGDFLDASRIEAGELDLQIVELDLREAATSVVHLYAPVSGDHELSAQVIEYPVCVRGDRGRIEQILGNLVSNAIKYSPEGGPVRVEVTSEGDQAVVAVSDRGVGIPENALEEVFQPFRRSHGGFQTSVPGAGLGLSIVHRLVAAHGGQIEVESTPGVGSTFCVRLPLAEGARRAPEERCAGETRRGA